MTSIPVDLHRNPAQQPLVPEQWTTRNTLYFTGIGLLLFVTLFGFMFSLSTM